MNPPLPNGRPLRVAWRMIERQRERLAMMSLLRTEELKEAFSQAEQGDPSALMRVVGSIYDSMAAYNRGPEAKSEQELYRQVIEQAAYARAGQYVERSEKGFRVWDFQKLLDSASSIEVTNGPDRLRVVISGLIPKQERYWVQTLDDPASVAFLRYMIYSGLFDVEAAKQPCPECHDKPLGIPAKACLRCGGLGWVIPDPDDQFAGERPDKPDAQASGRVAKKGE